MSTIAAPTYACERIETIPQNGALLVRGSRLIHGDGPYLPDHFPTITIFPGVFILETVVRSVAKVLGREALSVVKVRSLRFLVPLYPGDELRFEAKVSTDPVLIKATCLRADDVKVATLSVECG